MCVLHSIMHVPIGVYKLCYKFSAPPRCLVLEGQDAQYA